MMVAQALSPEDNYYAHPIEGVIATVEMDDMKVHIEDYGVVPVPPRSGNYTPDGIKASTNVPSFPRGHVPTCGRSRLHKRKDRVFRWRATR